MIFVSHYDSPLGILYLAADEEALKGVWFEGQKYFASGLKENGTEEKETPVLKRTRELAGSLFRRERSGVSSTAGAGRIRIPERGLEAPAYDPIREDDDLRRNRQKNC